MELNPKSQVEVVEDLKTKPCEQSLGINYVIDSNNHTYGQTSYSK